MTWFVMCCKWVFYKVMILIWSRIPMFRSRNTSGVKSMGINWRGNDDYWNPVQRYKKKLIYANFLIVENWQLIVDSWQLIVENWELRIENSNLALLERLFSTSENFESRELIIGDGEGCTSVLPIIKIIGSHRKYFRILRDIDKGGDFFCRA